MQLRVVDDPAPLVGVGGEQHGRVAHQLGHRLRPGPAEQRGEAGDLVVVEAGLDAVAPVDGDLGQPGEHVVGRAAPLVGGEGVEVADHLEHGVLPRRGRVHLAGLAVQAEVEPLADLLAFSLGHPEHPRDHLDGERRREVGHDVEPVPLGERFEEAGDDLAHQRLEAGDRPRGEHAADQGPEAVVLGRVHHDDHPEAADQLGILGQGRQVHAVRARQPSPVAMGADHVGEARQRVEPVASR